MSTLVSFRKVHKTIGVIIGIWLIVVACTGLMLGWKKTVGNPLQAPTEKGISSNLNDWLPIGELKFKADSMLKSQFSDAKPDAFKIDIRSKTEVVKFIYTKDFKEVQVDGQSGKILALNHRNSDWIEKLHEGAIFDIWAGKGSFFKHFFVTLGGIGIITLAISGFWLYLGPKLIRRRRRRTS